jgi:hypothetical protein
MLSIDESDTEALELTESGSDVISMWEAIISVLLINHLDFERDFMGRTSGHHGTNRCLCVTIESR